MIAKGPEAALSRLSTDPRVTVHRRGYGGPADLAGAVLCVASAAEPGRATPSPPTPAPPGSWSTSWTTSPTATSPPRRSSAAATWWSPSAPAAPRPALAARVRAELGERFGPEWTELVEVVGGVRAATLPRLPDFEDRSRRWRAALDLEELEA